MSFISTILCCPATLTTTNRSAVPLEEEDGAVVEESWEPGLVFSLPGESIPPSDLVVLSRDVCLVFSGICVASGLVGLVGPP